LKISDLEKKTSQFDNKLAFSSANISLKSNGSPFQKNLLLNVKKGDAPQANEDSPVGPARSF
jgi:hypothetical protein